jgi:hypothetical protein
MYWIKGFLLLAVFMHLFLAGVNMLAHQPPFENMVMALLFLLLERTYDTD